MKFLQIKNHAMVKVSNRQIAVVFGRSTFLLPAKLTQQFLKFRRLLIEGADTEKRLPKELSLFLSENDLFCSIENRKTYKKSYSRVEAESILSASIEMWKPLPKFHPIFKEMRKNTRLQYSFLLEQAIFVSNAYSYFSLASASTRYRKLSKIFKAIAKEEKNHYKGLLKDIKLSRAAFLSHDAAPGTTALVSFLHELAIKDPGALLIVTSLFETSDDEISQLREFYTSLSKSLKLNLKNFIGHHQLDVQLKHKTLWSEAFLNRNSISFHELSSWISALHTAKHLVELWFDSLMAEEERLGRLSRSSDFYRTRRKPNAETIYVGG